MARWNLRPDYDKNFDAVLPLQQSIFVCKKADDCSNIHKGFRRRQHWFDPHKFRVFDQRKHIPRAVRHWFQSDGIWANVGHSSIVSVLEWCNRLTVAFRQLNGNCVNPVMLLVSYWTKDVQQENFWLVTKCMRSWFIDPFSSVDYRDV